MDQVICFGQQPNGVLPKRFFYAKISTARKLQRKGGRIVFFLHDSDHDYRETQTKIKSSRYSSGFLNWNFDFINKVSKKWSPLYAKGYKKESLENFRNSIEKIVPSSTVKKLDSIQADNVTDVCLSMYEKLGILDGIEVVRSSDPEFRKKTDLSDFGNGVGYYYDIEWKGELVRAEICSGALQVHHGGNEYTKIKDINPKDLLKHPERISPGREKRFRWMQSVIGCTHYVAGNTEMGYLKNPEGVKIIHRDQIEDEGFAWYPTS